MAPTTHDKAPGLHPTALDQAITALQATNQHISASCTTCAQAALPQDMCDQGRALALAAVDTLTHCPEGNPT